MKIVKLLKSLSLPIQGLPTGRYVMKNTYQPQDVVAVHDSTLKSMPQGSFKLWSEDEGDFIDTKKNEETEQDIGQETTETDTEEEAEA